MHFLNNQGNTRIVRNIVIPAYRGTIFDRNGEKLAISLASVAVWIDPKIFAPTIEQIEKLTQLLDCSAKRFERLDKSKRFLYIKRGLKANIREKIVALNIRGLFTKLEYRRYYPYKEVTAQVLGFTNIDDQGQEGLELSYQCWLNGTTGLQRIMQNRLGSIIAKPITLKPASTGREIHLSLDQRIQQTTFQELAEGVKRYEAISGSAIVVDVCTGEILAMVNYPSYDPNQKITKLQAKHRNRCVTDVFEPGSTIKPFSMASVLENKYLAQHSLVNTTPGYLWIGNNLVRDHRNHGVITLAQILQVSSNVGISKLILSISFKKFLLFLHRMGFGQITHSRFPGERAGFLPTTDIKNPFVAATLSFGYGMSVTAIQLIQAYATLANYGVYMPITFLRRDTLPIGTQVMNKENSVILLKMLESVFEKEGTAPFVHSKNYRMAGKTGTTRLVGPTGYQNQYNSIFVGMAPASKPQLAVLVILYDLSSKKYYSGSTAAVIFAKIMQSALQIRNTPFFKTFNYNG